MRTPPRHSLTKQLLPALALCSAVACGGRGAEAPATQRLVDLYDPELVSGKPAAASALPRTEWHFGTASAAAAGAPAPAGWIAVNAVSGLSERSTTLAGRSTGAFPLIAVERTEGLDNNDILHALEVRLRVSAGRNLAFSWTDEAKPDFKRMIQGAQAFEWRNKTPIVAGDQMRTYVIRPPRRPPRSADMRHLVINPTDDPAATFEIESVRLIFRKEYLAGKASGVSWEGLSEIYRETLVSRAPETITFDLTLPQAAWLDLGLGTIETDPLTFRVALGAPGGAAPEEILTRTLTTPFRWERERIDLTRWAGRKVGLTLSLSGVHPGLIGFWGSPAVRTGAEQTRAASGQRPRNVILIMADTLRRDHLDVYGYGRPTAPELTKLASEGALFTDCVSQATWTKVATPTLMTSLYPSTHGVVDFSDRLPASAHTLAEVFRDAGRATLSMSSVTFTGKFTNLHQGFEELHEDSSLPDQESSKTAREYVDRLMPWLETHRDVPFFVYLHVTDPHDPFRPAPPYDTMWADASGFKRHEEETAKVIPFIESPLLKMFEMPDRAELVKAGIDADRYVGLNRDWYDGSIRGMDAEIARLVETLKGLGLDRSTLIAFVGDHGEEFLEHGRSFHGQSVYGELSNVPFILWGAGVPSGRRVDQTVSLLDVMPTLLELSGLTTPQEAQGRSLAPLLLGGAGAAGTAFVERAVTKEPTGAPPPIEAESRAIIMDGWKLIHNTAGASGKPEFELFSQKSDPLNMTNVAAQHPEIVAQLSSELQLWRTKALAARLKPESSTEGLSAEDLERLRSLGYIQ